MELEEGEIGDDGFGEIYVNNLYSHSTLQKSLNSPSLNNVDGDHNKLEESTVINGSEFNMETDLIRALMSSYGLSPVKSSVENKDGDSTDDFATELESQLLKDLNVKSLDDNVVCDEDDESEDSLVIVLNDDSDFIQVDSNIVDKSKIDEEELQGDLGFEFSGELCSTTLEDHSSLPVNKSANPVVVAVAPEKARVVPGVPTGVPTDVKIGGASISGVVLPHHMKVFDINIDDFEEKKWRKPDVDISDFFNYGLNEDKWKDYCKEMQQLCLKSSRKSNFVNHRVPKENHERDLASNVRAKTDVRYPDRIDVGGRNKAKVMAKGDVKMSNKISPSVGATEREIELGTSKQIPCITRKPSHFLGSGTIIEIVLQDSIYEDDRKMDEGKEVLEPLHRCSGSRIVHKNIHGDRIQPYPLDGVFINRTSNTHHRERFGDDYPRKIRGKQNYQLEKERNGLRLKQPYDQDNEGHKIFITKNITLKRTPYHPTNYGVGETNNLH